MKRTLSLIAAAMLLTTGVVYAQTKDDGATTPSGNTSAPKFQDGSGLSGESNTTTSTGTTKSNDTVKAPPDNDPATMKQAPAAGSSNKK